MKAIIDAIIYTEIALIGAVAIACYGRYNYYKGRLSKSAEIENEIHE